MVTAGAILPLTAALWGLVALLVLGYTTPVPTPAPTATPSPCPARLQDAINATPTGGTLRLGACRFFETVTVSRAMTIVGPAVIDGDGVRPTWMTVTASNVTVDGLSMRNAASAAYQSGSLNVDGVSGFTLRNATLTGGSYANLRLWNGSGHTVTNSTFTAGRAIGVLGWDFTDSVISANRMTGNNTTGADAGNEAGGIKLGKASRVTLSGNEVDGNKGPGIWCDVYCASITISNNRVHGNTHQGILFEISTGASITGNAVWENGWAFTSWGWGGGIVISSSGNADVRGNTVAWNADGIVVLSQNRSGAPAVSGNRVRDNVVAMAAQPGDSSDAYALAWLADWASPMFAPQAGNTGEGVAVAFVGTMPGAPFAWDGNIADPQAFGQTPGGTELQVLEPADAGGRLAAVGVPADPASIRVHSELTRREFVGRVGPLLTIAVALLILFLVIAVGTVRRRQVRDPRIPPSI